MFDWAKSIVDPQNLMPAFVSCINIYLLVFYYYYHDIILMQEMLPSFVLLLVALMSSSKAVQDSGHLIDMWNGLSQSIVDRAIDEKHKRFQTCVDEGYFKRLL